MEEKNLNTNPWGKGWNRAQFQLSLWEAVTEETQWVPFHRLGRGFEVEENTWFQFWCWSKAGLSGARGAQGWGEEKAKKGPDGSFDSLMRPSWSPAFPWNWNLFLHKLCTFGVCFSSFLRLLAIIIPPFCGSGQLYGGKIIPQNGFHLSQMKKKKQNPVIRFIIKWSSFWVYNDPPGQRGQPQNVQTFPGKAPCLSWQCALLKSLQTTQPDSVATAAAARPQLQLFNGLRCLAGFQAWGPKDKPD